MTEVYLQEVQIGLDISTSVVGIVLLDAKTNELVKMDSIKLNTVKLVDVWDKAKRIREYFTNNIVNRYKIKDIFVEEAHMAFTPGFSSAGTLFSLARFNGIVSFMAHELFGPKPTMVNVRSARKAIGLNIDYKDKSRTTKNKVVLFVTTLHPDFPWIINVAKTGKNKGKSVLAKENEDRCDAYVICKGGIKLGSTPTTKKISKKNKRK